MSTLAFDYLTLQTSVAQQPMLAASAIERNIVRIGDYVLGDEDCIDLCGYPDILY